MPGLIALTTLSQCVYLRSFTLRLSSSSPSLLAHLLKAGQLPSSITHLKVILEVDAFHMHGDDVQKWNYVDQQACSELSALTSFIVVFAVRTHYRKETWATMLRGQIPLLQARGVVQIDDLGECYRFMHRSNSEETKQNTQIEMLWLQGTRNSFHCLGRKNGLCESGGNDPAKAVGCWYQGCTFNEHTI
jgi:hypothetical protein